MKTATIRGVPPSVQRDGWWMDRLERKPSPDPDARRSEPLGFLLLLALLALGDALFWQVIPGLSIALFALCLVGGALLSVSYLSPARVRIICLVTAMSVLPVVELVQPLSVLLLVLGIASALCLIAGARLSQLPRALRRYPWVAIKVTSLDAVALVIRIGSIRIARTDVRRLVVGWSVPLVLGLIFVMLLSGANPVIEGFFFDLSQLELTAPEIARVWMWAGLGLLILLALAAGRLGGSLSARKPERHTVKRPGLINAASVTRSLVLFNALFGVQTVMDLVFLYGGTGLPEGMSYATYAHRGAYPLLVTALLAGGFALLAQPFTQSNAFLRRLLLLWLGQTLALVLASAIRLEVYVDIYGLTRLRMAAAIWMAVVAFGLSLQMFQVLRQLSVRWMLSRAALLGVATLYISAFINIDGAIARYNLTQEVRLDRSYICGLSEGVVPVLVDLRGGPLAFCATVYETPRISLPGDWREWGFRNWRLRRSVTAMTVAEALQ